MRNLKLFVLVLVSQSSFAQQSLFNVPSSEITKVGHIFFQEQLGISGIAIQSNTVTCYGLPYEMEVGLDLVNLDVNRKGGGEFFETNDSDPNRALSPQIAATFQKGFEIGPLNLGFGTIVGSNLLSYPRDWRLSNFSYVNSSLALPWDLGRIYLGGFFANRHYVGRNDTFNFMAGAEIRVIPDCVHIVVDHIHGTHELGVSVAGVAVYVQPHIVVSLGAQLPNADSGNSHAIVTELTLL